MLTGIGSDPRLASLGLEVPTGPDSKESLGQEEFLKLMITQLENQDPFKPLESGEFLGQLAQFGTVSGLAEIKTAFDDLAGSLVSNQALQASALVGRRVLVPSSVAPLADEGAISGAIEMPESSSDVQLQIRDATGQLVGQLDLGAQGAGLTRFAWEATGLLPGRYSVSANYIAADEVASAPVLIEADVESVGLGPRGLTLRLRGLDEVPFSAIREIG